MCVFWRKEPQPSSNYQRLCEPEKRLRIDAVDRFQEALRLLNRWLLNSLLLPTFRPSRNMRIPQAQITLITVTILWSHVIKKKTFFFFLQRNCIKIDTWGDFKFTWIWCASAYFFLITSSHLSLSPVSFLFLELGTYPRWPQWRIPTTEPRVKSF